MRIIRLILFCLVADVTALRVVRKLLSQCFRLLVLAAAWIELSIVYRALYIILFLLFFLLLLVRFRGGFRAIAVLCSDLLDCWVESPGQNSFLDARPLQLRDFDPTAHVVMLKMSASLLARVFFVIFIKINALVIN